MMYNRVTSEEVANQIAKGIQLLLTWLEQEILPSSQVRSSESIPDRGQVSNQLFQDSKRLLKATEVAELLGISKSFVYNLMKRGEIPTVRLGTALRVKQSDLEEFIK
jgi:excisionase family DNA binding protein